MQKLNQQLLKFNLDHIEEGLTLEIAPEQQSRIRQIENSVAAQFNESAFQLFEGHSYEFEFEGKNKANYQLQTRINGLVIPSNRHPYRGRITPNIYVGQLQLQISNIESKQVFPLVLEVIATKFNKKEDASYRENYRKMLEDITDKCTDLMMQINTPVTQTIAIDYTTDTKTLYQRFCFVKSFLDTADFEEAILRIISNPSAMWNSVETSIKTSQIKRVNCGVAKQLVNASNRIDSSNLAYLRDVGLHSIPTSIQSTTRVESVDTSENRFIKHVLGVFLNFVEDCQAIFAHNNSFQYAYNESSQLIEKINGYLSYSFFNEISAATTLKLNSPLLQKRSGYREVLNRWLQFHLASKLIWQGGEEVYEAGKRDIATLYEYWLFFQLYDLIIQKFNLQAYQNQNFDHLFEMDEAGLSLKLKSGKELVIKGETNFESRNLTIRFSYNRTFKGGSDYTSGKAGSITTTLRPDYTLSIWPSSFTETEAEKEDVITHIHFDAKYKIQNIQEQYTQSDEESVINRIDERERKGTFKNIDILKMHTYKDAIRRTGGAYILYPGNVEKRFDGFHEVLPGLGAFTINPSKYNTGISGLSKFLDQVILHLADRTTQRERITNVSNQILKEPRLKYGKSLKPIPTELEKAKIDVLQTYVLVGYAKSQKHLDWCISKGLYNFRMNDNVGSLEFSPEVVHAKYLLLRENGKEKASKLFKITSKGPKVYSKDKLISLNYDNPSQPDYLMVTIEPCYDWENLEVNFKEFQEYINLTGTPYSKAGKPFVVTLDQILKT
ncbi:DUF2357 domain-containing protein [Flavobacterium sp. xlx-214]|uniref:DUF2357 domain-containing protein n=1 Tax=unclassified Flavobacterium TaxID=196869 RepID=UPI0013D7C5DD|nr:MULTISPECIES: DUF2357 domain-containing protein [unclassified Flavobacterium]MBA5791721.1 DUF2357 domain-containing protein [Flavobacterium sp. xlx-221]QMI82960.1 DUF2357 domain-containing protein [Flavobacterium sp. xlx-214]